MREYYCVGSVGTIDGLSCFACLLCPNQSVNRTYIYGCSSFLTTVAAPINNARCSNQWSLLLYKGRWSYHGSLVLSRVAGPIMGRWSYHGSLVLSTVAGPINGRWSYQQGSLTSLTGGETFVAKKLLNHGNLLLNTDYTDRCSILCWLY